MVGTGDGGGTQVGSLAAATVPAPAPAPAPVAMGPFLEGPIGSKLGASDRDAAFKAEIQAVSLGERRTWRGAKGIYGFVVPGPAGSGTAAADATATAGGPAAPGECRTFTHTVYFGGRPQAGHGTGCRDAEGTWQIVS